MSFGAPMWLAVGAAAAMVVVALHFLARQRPRSVPFPTARFIPERVARAPSRALRPSDLLLLALRATVLMLLGAAFARPVWDAARSGTVRIVVVDRSRAVRSATEARDSALSVLGARDRLVLFDSSGREVTATPRDSLTRFAIAPVSGSIAAALIAAQRAAATLAGAADSVEIVLVSPLSREEWDAATRSIRALWPGRLRLVRVAMATADSVRALVEIRGATDDPLRTAGFGGRRAISPVRVVRGDLAPGDSAWAADRGSVLVHWPARFEGVIRDTIGAVALADDVVVAPFARGTFASDPRATVVARWADGTSAASQRPAGSSGCVREVAIPVPTAGDLVLRESFRRLTAGLFAPCGGARDVRPIADSLVTVLSGVGALAAGSAVSGAEPEVTPLARWMLIAAALLLLAEPVLRRRAA